MSDFERRVEEALASGAEGAPDASGLAEGARRRSRQRRRTTIGVAAAAVVAAVAVPVGVIALNDGGGDGGEVAEDPSTPSDTRIETWHDIQVEVPASWGYGARTAWCTGGEAETPVVERPGGVVAAIACDPANSFGVSWVDGTTEIVDPVYPSGEVWQYETGDYAEYVPGSWLGYWYEGDDMVQVNAADKETVEQVLDSVQRVRSVDGNGCPVTRQEGFASDSEQLSVCRYDAAGELEQSELLSPEDTDAALAALRAAPAGDAKIPASCAQDQLPRLVVQMINADLNSEVIIQAPCPYKPGITSGGESFQELTPDVLYWALSPGWTGSLQDVSMPAELRTLPAPEPTEPPAEESPCPEGYFANSDFALDADNGEPMTVCRMEVTWEGESGGSHLLDDTTELTQAESDAVRAALEAAPVAEESDFKDCRTGEGEFFLVLAGDAVPLWVHNGECGELTAMTQQGGEVVHHEVTEELLDALGSPYGLLR